MSSVPRGITLIGGPVLEFYLRQLLATGLYGATLSDVALHLIQQKLQELLRHHQLSQAELPDPNAVICSNCGSPKTAPLAVHGGNEYQCQDCWTIFAKSIDA